MATAEGNVVFEEGDTVEDTDSNDAPASRESETRRSYSKQFDVWLIRASARRRVVEFILACPLVGITRDNNTLCCRPLRIDDDFICVLVDETEVWINRELILTCRPMNKSPKTQESVSGFSEE